MTDLEVIREVLAGRRELFAVLVDRYKNLVHAVIRSFQAGADTEDAAQEVFIKAYRALDRYRGEASFSTWLYRITLNHLKDCGRRFVPSTIALDGLDSAPAAQEVACDPLAEALALERRLLVQSCLAELPETYRLVIYLHYYHDLSYAEIAGRLSLSERGVETRLYRATKMLRDRLTAREVSARCTTG